MPINITDVDTFTDPIVVPADADPADATYVRTVGQGAGNRTRYLHNRVMRPCAGGLRITGTPVLGTSSTPTKVPFDAIYPSAGAVVDGVVLPSPAGDNITVESGGAGLYRVDFQLPTNSVTVTTDYVFTVFVNGASSNVRAFCVAAGANLDYPPIGFGFLELEDGDVVDVRVSAGSGTPTVTFSSQGTLMLQRLTPAA